MLAMWPIWRRLLVLLQLGWLPGAIARSVWTHFGMIPCGVHEKKRLARLATAPSSPQLIGVISLGTRTQATINWSHSRPFSSGFWCGFLSRFSPLGSNMSGTGQEAVESLPWGEGRRAHREARHLGAQSHTNQTKREQRPEPTHETAARPKGEQREGAEG